MEDIKRDYNKYDTEDWVKADEKFKKFSRDYYDKFYEELSKGERIQLRLYRVDYLKYKTFFKGKRLWEEIEDAFL